MARDKAIDESKAMEEIAERLQERFPEASRQTIVDAIEKARAGFDGAKVRDFVPVLIEKEAKAHLKGKR
ncbi:hypothetical protein [Microbacterium sp. BK668]|uniref:three-helix bundle dimerization domain-containing protein n=1 Tax=Microbacterium sp. BK668 TaxID=2512118 RepID=UPI00105D5E65|nr:hypothetical protein [Microbacterium sp. BK668]TDN91510.1 hypothetical protein EV279_1010 [Microbacterium sp. BK668]